MYSLTLNLFLSHYRIPEDFPEEEGTEEVIKRR